MTGMDDTAVAVQAPARWKSLLRVGLTVALLALVLAFIDVPASIAAVAGADPWWLLAGLITNFLGTILIPGRITQLALAVQGRHLSMARLTEINLTNRFYILVLPRAAAVAIRWYRYGDGKLSAPALALMLFERGIQLATLMVLSLLAIWADRAALGTMATPLTLALAGGTALSLLVLLPFASAWAEATSLRVLALFARLLPQAIVTRFERLISAAALFRQLDHGPAMAMMGWSVVATMLFYASAWFAAGAMGLEISLLSLVWIRSLVFLLTLIPLTIGGLGVRELGFVGLLGLIGINSHEALAFSAVNFAFQIAVALLGAAIEGWRIYVTRSPSTGKETPAC